MADGIANRFLSGQICWQWTCCLHLCLFNRSVWVCLTLQQGIEKPWYTKQIPFKIFCILEKRPVFFQPHCILTWEYSWYSQYKKNICVYIGIPGYTCVHWVFGLKSFITLCCTEHKSKAPSEEEGHLNNCQELIAHCTQLPLTSFHH